MEESLTVFAQEEAGVETPEDIVRALEPSGRDLRVSRAGQAHQFHWPARGLLQDDAQAGGQAVGEAGAIDGPAEAGGVAGASAGGKRK